MDNPIESKAQDVLGRAPLAHDFARSLRSLDSSRGAVVGVLGPWGHGKSSFINLMREEFAADPKLAVIDFNPWMFSGTQQLVDHFFDELATHFKQLKDPTLKAAAKLIEEYGESISSVAGLLGPLGVLGAAVFRGSAKTLSRHRGARDKYRKASELLAKLEQPLVVVIDDIDRLTSEEIRDVFKLVRLTASFPNVIYLLAFDRARVEEALTEPGIPGRTYLEKIIQLGFDLPATPPGVLRSHVFSALDASLSGLEGEPRLHMERWPDIYVEIIEPLISNMRDVVRFAASVRPTLYDLAAEIESVDLFAMEAFRIFRPDMFLELRTMTLTLTETAPGGREAPERKERIQALVTSAGDDAEVVRSLIRRVFPAAQRHIENNNYGAEWKPIWRKEHRLAHADFLAMYFNRVAPASLKAFRLAEDLRVAMETRRTSKHD
ncbi:MAG: P-loop NTPase fold protein [Pseudolysinimonas sp.]